MNLSVPRAARQLLLAAMGVTVRLVDPSWDCLSLPHTPCFLRLSQRLVDFYFAVTVGKPSRSRPHLEAHVSDAQCRRRKDKGRFFSFFSVADRGASRRRRTAGGLIKDVKRSVLARWLSVLRIRSAVSANRDTQNKHKHCLCFSFIVSFIGFSWLRQTWQNYRVNHTPIAYMITIQNEHCCLRRLLQWGPWNN